MAKIKRSIFQNNRNITVSIVTYNSADEIDILMSSIEKSTYFNEITVYVVDNSSVDNTVEIVRRNYPWAKIIKSKKNLGFGRAHNLVIKNVYSKYHIIVNPDISIFEDTIKNVVEYLDENPNVVLMSPFVMNTDGTQQYLPKKDPSLKYMIGGLLENYFCFCKKLRDEYTMKNEIIEAPVDVEHCTGCFMCTRTEALHKVGGFDERYFLYFEDSDLTRKLRKVGRTVYNPEIKVIHKWHRENKKFNKSFWIALRSMILYLKKWRKQ